MSLVQQVAALRLYFGVPDALQLLPAMALMNEMMGIDAEGSVPHQVELLVKMSGITVGTQAAKSTASAALVAAATAPGAGKRKTFQSHRPLAPGLQTLFSLMPDAQKTHVPFSELKKQRVLAIAGEDYEPKKGDMRTFDSECVDSPLAPPSVKKYQ